MDKRKFEKLMWDLPPLLYFIKQAGIIKNQSVKKQKR